MRVFLEPDANVLLQANTNAGGKLRQVAFDPAVMRHLGSTIYVERLNMYRQMRGLAADDYSFSESDLVRFYRGESRETERYIVDAQRDAVNSEIKNTLLQFVEWTGKGATRPLSYMPIERSFLKELLYKKALDSPLDDGMEQGTNPRQMKRNQVALYGELPAQRVESVTVVGFEAKPDGPRSQTEPAVLEAGVRDRIDPRWDPSSERALRPETVDL